MKKEINLITDAEMDFLVNALFTDEFPNLIETMDEPKFSINDLKIAPRDATYWDKQGILPTMKGTSMRRKYDLIQSVWLKLIQQMRSLGISLMTIKELKENLLEPNIDISQLDQASLTQIISKLSSKFETSFTPDQLLKEISESGTSIFKSAVLVTIIYRKSIHCLVNKDGGYIIYDSNNHQKLLSYDPEFADFISEPYFCINLSLAYQSLVKEWLPEPFIADISILSKSELIILEKIRQKNVNSITIRYKKGEPDLIEVEEQSSISIDQRFLDIITKNGYHKITVSTRDGKIVHYENKILKKLNKSTK